jgi:sugar lactone lactonase YvrE
MTPRARALRVAWRSWIGTVLVALAAAATSAAVAMGCGGGGSSGTTPSPDASVDALAEAAPDSFADAPEDAADAVADASDAPQDTSDTADGGPLPDTGSEVGSLLGTVDFVSGVSVSTLAGSATPGSADGTGAAASFDNPTGVALSAGGELFVVEYDGDRVRAITAAGVTRTVAAATNFVGPFSIAFVPGITDAVFVGTDFDLTGTKGPTSGTVWRVPLGGTGVATPTVLTTDFGRPRGMTGLADGRLFVTDRLRSRVGIVDLGTKSFTPIAGQDGVLGFADGTGTAARFQGAHGCAQLADGSVIVADMLNHRLRKVTLAGAVTTFAGSGVAGTHDADAAIARFQSPRDVAVDAAGNVYVVDVGVVLGSGTWVDVRVRRISPSGAVQTLAGDGSPGSADGAGSTAEFYGLEGIDVTPDGKTVYVSDGNGGDGTAHHRIRKITVP